MDDAPTEADQTTSEQHRLQLVRRLGLLDSPPDERFDVFTRLAASVTRSPVSTISLIDESRVWFKSSVGLPDGVTEVPRDIAACAHVANSPDRALVVPDARLDPRLSGSPLVTGEFGMRFYAGAPLRAPSGEVLGSLCVIDRTPREPDPGLIRALEDLAHGVSTALRIHEMSELVLKDLLTGLGNRRLFEGALAEALVATAAGSTVDPVGLLLVDLDRFKQFNETLGHSGGNAVLREVGQRIAGAVRQGDTAARLGGDEFAILLPIGPREDVESACLTVALRIQQAISGTPIVVENQRMRVEASIGLAFVDGPIDADGLLRAADVALYNAKRDGRNRIGRVAGKGATGIGSKNRLVADLRASLAAGGEGLSLVLQPLRLAADGRTISSYEALVRWTHPFYGPVSPGDFVPVAERSGLATALDGWVLREACRIAARFPAPRPVIAVNITPSFLVSPDFLPAVDQALADAALKPQNLCIELTERVFLDDLEPAKIATAALMDRGVQVALDDFGAGHASFGYLTDVAVSKIKIDGSLIAALGQAHAPASRAGAIVRGVIAMARELGLGVVAEGVETAGQLRTLQEFGADEVQGWHVGRPALPSAWLPDEHAVPRRAA